MRVLPIDGQTFLLGGAQGGCCLVPSEGPHGVRALPFPGDIRRRGGVNATAVAGPHLVATHSGVGVVAWDLSHPAAPGARVLTHLTDRARTVRGVQVRDDQCWLAVDDAIYAFHAPRFPDGTPTKYRGAGAPITALVASRTHVYAGTADGQIWRWRIGDPDRPEAELPRRTSPVTMLRLAVVGGAPVLLAAWTGYGVIAKTLGDDSMTQYHAEHPVRWVAGGPDCVAGVDRDGHTLVLWEPSRPKARWRRYTARGRMQDLWAWTAPAPDAADVAVTGGTAGA